MISPVTWLWNIRHRKLIDATKRIMRFYWFLRHDCGLKYADKLSAKELKSIYTKCTSRYKISLKRGK